MPNNKSPESSPPPKLKVSRAEAAQKIRAQIKKGHAIPDTIISSDEEFAKAESQYGEWNAYNIKLLTRLFSNKSMADEYEYDGPYPDFYDSNLAVNIQRLRKSLDTDISTLESILQRLDLIPEPTQASTAAPAPSAQQAPLSREVFIVHGHDDAAKELVARVLSQLDLKPIILNEKADAGLTVIEKLEKHANVAFAVILLTPDDIGCAKKEPDQQKPRARQNVILEFGYFLGKLGRGKVCALYKEGVELPSDLYGILYVSMDASGAWKFRLAKELSQAGIKVDSNALLAD